MAKNKISKFHICMLIYCLSYVYIRQLAIEKASLVNSSLESKSRIILIEGKWIQELIYHLYFPFFKLEETIGTLELYRI